MKLHGVESVLLYLVRSFPSYKFIVDRVPIYLYYFARAIPITSSRRRSTRLIVNALKEDYRVATGERKGLALRSEAYFGGETSPKARVN